MLREGPNRIEAVARGKGCELRDSVVQEYTSVPWGAPAQLRLTLTDEDAETLLVEAELLDAAGRRCLDAADIIRFTSTDPTALLRNRGTARGSAYIQAANGRAVIRVRKSAAPHVVCARCDRESVAPAFITLQQSEKPYL